MVAEHYGSSADQAEELAAQALETVAQQDETIRALRDDRDTFRRLVELRDEVIEALKLERDRARGEAAQLRRDLAEAMAELRDLRAGRRETYSRALGGER